MQPQTTPAPRHTAPGHDGADDLTADLAAMIGSRICHDLISPIGAIGNGVELLLMEGASKSPEMALIAESVSHANARIRFFRVGFGVADDDQRIGRAEAVSILSDLTRGGRLTIDWHSASDLPRAEVKMCFLAIMALETALAFGGRIAVVQEGADWTLSGEAPRLRMDPAIWAALSNPVADTVPVTAARVQFALLRLMLDRAGRRIRLSLTETMIRVSF